MVMMVDSAVFLSILTGLVIRTWGQQLGSIVINVGIEGSFYDPGTVSAGMNDIVTFIFGGDMHDVTQSSFEEPCTPLPGGFSSGLAGRGSNFSLPAPIWNLEITNVSAPLWFFCGASRPSSHCATGMVGAINPPSQDMYNAFVEAARNTSPTATLSVLSYSPNGIGAFATSSPTPTANVSSTPPPTTTTTSSSASAPTSTSENPNSNNTQSDTSRLGAIIGGSIGGAVAIGGFIIIILVLRRTGRRQSRRRSELIPHMSERVWDGYDRGGGGIPASPPLTGISERSKIGGGDVYSAQALGYYGHENRGEVPNRYNNDTPANFNAPRNQPSTGALQPNRKLPGDVGGVPQPPPQPQPQPHPQIPHHPYAMTNAVDQDHDDDFVSRLSGGDVDPPAAGDVAIAALAKQVAKVLMNGNPSAPSSTVGESQAATDSDGLPMEGTKGRRLVVAGLTHQDSIGKIPISRESPSTAPPLYRSYDEGG